MNLPAATVEEKSAARRYLIASLFYFHEESDFKSTSDQKGICMKKLCCIG